MAADIIQKNDQLRSERSQWNTLLQECSDLVLPQRGAFTQNIVKGEVLTDKVFDTTAIWANEQFAAGLHGFVSPTTQRWIKFTLNNEELMDIDEVRHWLDEVADVIYGIVYHPKANFVAASHEFYLDLGALGTSPMFIEEVIGSEHLVRFHTHHLNECVFQENAAGVIDCVYREFKWTVRKVLEKFPDTAGEKIIKMYEKNPGEMVSIVHSIRPSVMARSKMLGFEFESAYVLKEEKRLLRTGNFYEFPYAIPRWSKITGEVMGRSPAMTCLQDIRMINEMSKTTLKAAQKIVDPILMMPDEGFLMPIKTTPGSINYYEAGREDRIEPLQTGGDIGLGLEMMNQRREQILRSFFLDSMKLQKETVEMTAYETATREEENMRSMSPMVSRIQSEGFTRIIERVIAIAGRAGRLPPPPVEMGDDVEYKIEYMSPISRALKMSQLTGVTRMIDVLAPLAQIKPQMLDKINEDELVDFAAGNMEVPLKLMRTDKQVGELRQQRAEQEAKMQEQAMANAQADTIQKGAKAVESIANARR